MYRYFSWFGLSGKLVLSGLMSLLAVGLLVGFPSAQRLFVAAAMALSSCGDAAMVASNKNESRQKMLFALGAAFFAVAHLCYIKAYLTVAETAGVTPPNMGTYAGAVLFLAGVFCLLLFLILGKTTFLRLLGALAYLAVICLNCTVIFTYAIGVGGRHLLAGVGALSFFVSDFLIGLKVFGGVRSDKANEAVWWFYPIGQILLIVFL